MADKRETPKRGSDKRSKRGRGDEPVPYSSVATHPRASAQVRAAKGWGGMIGFVVAAALSAKASVPFVQSCERALIFGIVGYLLAWGLSLMVWRQWMIAEQRAAVEEIERRRDELEAEMNAAKEAATKPAGRQAGNRAGAGAAAGRRERAGA